MQEDKTIVSAKTSRVGEIMTVRAVILNGLTVAGYKVEDKDENELRVDIKTFSDLVRNKEIDGVSIIELEGEEYIVGLNIRDLGVDMPLKVEIVSKEMNDSGVIGYKVIRRGDTSEKSISIHKAWELSAIDCISNARAMFTGKGEDIRKYIKCDTV